MINQSMEVVGSEGGSDFSCSGGKVGFRIFTVVWASLLNLIMYFICDVKRSMAIEPVVRLVFYVQLVVVVLSTLSTIYEIQLFRNGPKINPLNLCLPFLIDLMLMILMGCTSTIATFDYTLYRDKYKDDAHMCKPNGDDNVWLSPGFHVGNCYFLFTLMFMITLMSVAKWWPSRPFIIPDYKKDIDYDMEYTPYPNLYV